MLDGKIETFLVVAQCGSYTKAAELLHFTQPAITQQIRRLEEHYGCSLVRFRGRSFSLTAEGRALLEYAKAQKANEQRLRERLSHMAHPLRVGATLSIADYYLPPLLEKKNEQPGFCLQVEVGNTKTLLENIMDGRLDCAFIEGTFDGALFTAIPFCQAAFLPVVRTNHPLARKKVSFETLYQFPVLLREEGSGTRAILEHFLASKNSSVLAFERQMEAGSFLLLKKLLQSSDAVSFLYEKVVAEEWKQQTLQPVFVKEFPLYRQMHFVYAKGSLAAKECEDFFSRLQPIVSD